MSVRHVARFARVAVVEQGRSPMAWLLRGGLAALLLGCLLIVEAAGGFFGAPGQRLLVALTAVDFAVISAAGASLFAAAIREERERGTLDLLRVAGLGPFAILAGKTVQQLVLGASLLVVQAPFVALTVTLGGAAREQVEAALLLLLSYLWLAAGLGIACSALLRGGVPASLSFVAAIGILHAGAALGGSPHAAPWFALEAVLATGGGHAESLAALVACGLLGLFGFVAAWLALWLRSAPPAEAVGRDHRARWPPWSGDPIRAKEVRQIMGGPRGIVARYAALPVVAAALAALTPPWLGLFDGRLSAAVVVVGSLDWLWLSCASFGQELRAGTLVHLAMLPRPILQVANAKRDAWLLLVGVYLPPFLLDSGWHPWSWFGLAYLLLVVYPATLLGGWLSLRLPRGAFPITLAAVMGVTLFFPTSMRLLGVVSGCGPCMGLAAIVVFYAPLVRFLRRRFDVSLRQAAGETGR